MNNDDKKKVYLSYRGFSAQNFISVFSFLEYSNFVKDGVFITFREGVRHPAGFKYDKENEITMSISAIDLRALAYGIKDIVKNKSNALPYKNITRSDAVKTLSLKYVDKKSDGEFIYIQVLYKKKVIGVEFNKWEALSFSDSLKIIADGTEKSLYMAQRKINKT